MPRVIDTEECAALRRHLAELPDASVGTRNMLASSWCRGVVLRLREDAALACLIPASHVAVQCTYFAKSSARNWLVPVHQDTSIPVLRRVEHPELRTWSVKEGGIYVQPPQLVLEQLLAIRLHLDPCGVADGPLRIVPGSHLLGLVPSEAAVEARVNEISCVAEAGDALVMRPLLLHSSSRSRGTGRRRVLHFLFGPPELPFGLAWRRAA
jgi:hypothetical protein